jgi:hypothetical protein
VSLECRVARNPAGRFADIEDFQDFDTIATLLREGFPLEIVAWMSFAAATALLVFCSWPSPPYRKKSERVRARQ